MPEAQCFWMSNWSEMKEQEEEELIITKIEKLMEQYCNQSN